MEGRGRDQGFQKTVRKREGGKEGRRDGLTHISAPWLQGLRVIVTLNSQYSQLSVTHTLRGLIKTGVQGICILLISLHVCHTTCEFSRCGLLFLIPTCAHQLIEDPDPEDCQHQDFFHYINILGVLLPHLPVTTVHYSVMRSEQH